MSDNSAALSQTSPQPGLIFPSACSEQMLEASLAWSCGKIGHQSETHPHRHGKEHFGGGIVGHSFDSTTKMLFPMSLRVIFTLMISFLMRWTLSSNANAMNNTMNDTMSVPLPSPVKMRPSLIIDPHNGQAFAETEG